MTRATEAIGPGPMALVAVALSTRPAYPRG